MYNSYNIYEFIYIYILRGLLFIILLFFLLFIILISVFYFNVSVHLTGIFSYTLLFFLQLNYDVGHNV